MNKDIGPHQPGPWHINKLRSKGSVSSSLCLSVMTAHYIAMRCQGERQLALMVRENETHTVYVWACSIWTSHSHISIWLILIFTYEDKMKKI